MTINTPAPIQETYFTQMNKEELIEAVADRADLTKTQARDAIDALLKEITLAVADGDKVLLVGFGSFQARERQARTARNPKTGEPMEIPATTVPVFSPGKLFRDAVKSNN